MIRSMTGFGKAEAAVSDRKIIVEIRTLNSKQLDLSVRMPSRYRSLDPEIRTISSKMLQRGKADIYVNIESAEGNSPASIDQALFATYLGRLRKILSDNGISNTRDPLIESQLVSSVLRMPDVVGSGSDTVTDEESAALVSALNNALSAIDRHRIDEGRILIGDIMGRVSSIADAIPQVEPFEKERVESIRKRIAEAIEKSGVAVDSNRLEQEIIFYLEKLDVTEEKVRLANHCRYFREVAESEEYPGRKLGFIAQEMGREINTLGSKANHSQMQKIVVGMKDELEKIKEQLLNIL